MVEKIQAYVPGYRLIVPPTLENDRIVIMVRVLGLGDYLPKYAGNLDIINCAAIAMAEDTPARTACDEGGQGVSETCRLTDQRPHAARRQPCRAHTSSTRDQLAGYAAAADAAGVPIVEVGHGNGLGASSLQVGEAR